MQIRIIRRSRITCVQKHLLYPARMIIRHLLRTAQNGRICVGAGTLREQRRILEEFLRPLLADVVTAGSRRGPDRGGRMTSWIPASG